MKQVLSRRYLRHKTFKGDFSIPTKSRPIPARPAAALAPAPLLFYRLPGIDLVAPAHWLPAQWKPMHCNCSCQVSEQPEITLKEWRISHQNNKCTSGWLLTLQCFNASLNSLFLMASLALFSVAFTSLLDIFSAGQRRCLKEKMWHCEIIPISQSATVFFYITPIQLTVDLIE